MAPHDQPWLAFSRVRWRGGFERRLVRVFDDRIEVRAGRFAISTVTVSMNDVYDVALAEDGGLRIVAVPDDIVITEGTDRDRSLAAELIRKNAPPPRKKPKPPAPTTPPPPQPKPPPPPKPEPEPEPEPEPPVPPEPGPAPPERPEDGPREAPPPAQAQQPSAARALALLTIGAVMSAITLVIIVGAFVWVVVRLFQG